MAKLKIGVQITNPGSEERCLHLKFFANPNTIKKGSFGSPGEALEPLSGTLCEQGNHYKRTRDPNYKLKIKEG